MAVRAAADIKKEVNRDAIASSALAVPRPPPALLAENRGGASASLFQSPPAAWKNDAAARRAAIEPALSRNRAVEAVPAPA